MRTISEIKYEISQGKSWTEVRDEYLKRISELEDKVKAFTPYGVYEDAKVYSDSGELYGIPIAIKDNICEEGRLTTCCSRILEGFRPPYDATVVKRLKEAGAIILGKTNMDEFAFGSSCETSCYYPTRNPWDLERVPGGSSGGSAAAVSAGMVPVALGSDTGGSIRQPASLCGVVGLKPTYGRVSRYGLIAFASSLDQIGVFSRTVEDSARVLKVIAGFDEMDSTSAPVEVEDYLEYLDRSLKGVKVGIPKEYFGEGIDPEVRHFVNNVKVVLQDLGAECKEVSLPHTKYCVATYYIVATAEASSNLARFDGVQYGLRVEGKDLVDMYFKTREAGFGAEAKRRIILGTYVLSSGYYDAYYLRAQKVRALIKRDFDEVFTDCDVVMTPTSPTPAFKLGEKLDNPLAMYLSDVFTISANLAGLPAISVPCGLNSDKLPIGVQFIGKAFDEKTIFKVAYAYEQATPWHQKEPVGVKDFLIS